MGICTGILADGEVNENEAIFFAEWVRKHAPNEPVWPFTDILQRIERIFADGVCDVEERAELKDVMEALCGFTEQPVPMAENLSTTLPLCMPQPYPLVFANQQWGGPVETDSELRYTDLKVAFKLVRRAIAQRGVPPVEIEVGVEVVGDL